jgi:hypothetical protein
MTARQSEEVASARAEAIDADRAYDRAQRDACIICLFSVALIIAGVVFGLWRLCEAWATS